MNVLVLGPQGSGKGTQAKRVSAEHDIPHVSTGDMFRALDDATPLGREVNEIMERGDLVPDEITIRMIRERLAEEDAATGSSSTASRATSRRRRRSTRCCARSAAAST